MRKTVCAVASAALIGFAGTAGDAQQNQEPAQGSRANDQQPTIRVGVNFVRIDTIVTDRDGKPVTDLTPDDFQITEGGKTQKIETFKLVSLDGGLMQSVDAAPRPIRSDTDEEIEAARDDVRLFGIFLDDYHVMRENSPVVRQQLGRFIETQLGPSDMVATMMPQDSLAAIRYTRRHEGVVRGIQQFEGRKYDYRPRSQAEERLLYAASAETMERVRNEISFDAIKAFIMRMGGLKEGRKALILVSEGYSNTLPPQMRDIVTPPPTRLAGPSQPGDRRREDPRRLDPQAGDTPLEARRQAMGGMEMMTELREVYELANRYNTSIYVVDPRGLAVSEFGIERNVSMSTDRQFLASTLDTLRMLADNTDGRAIVNTNELLPAMKQIVTDSSAYYLLGYNSSVGRPDGKFHQVDVTVKRRGVQVRHRKGYWALKPEEASRLNAPMKITPPSVVEVALAANAAPRNRPIRTWLGMSRGEEGRTRLMFVWETIDDKTYGSRDIERPAQVAITAVGAGGTPYYKGTAAPGRPDAAARISFDVPPGRVQLRLSTQTADGKIMDTDIREIAVPDLTVPTLTIGTPEVFRARTVPELQRLRSDLAAIPTAVREFRRTDRLLIRVPAYSPSGTVPAMTARLLNKAGQAMADLPVAAPTLPSIPELDLGLGNFPSGEYAVELTLGGDASVEPVKAIVAFRVAS